MIKITIKNSSGIISGVGTFNTDSEAENWLKKNIDNNVFGKSERTVRKKIEKNGVFVYPDEVYIDSDVIKESFKEVFSGKFTEEKDMEGNIKNIPILKKEYYVTLKAQFTFEKTDNTREELLKTKTEEINKNVEKLIINSFYSNCSGEKIHYQSSLTDQFEISQIMMAGIDYNIKIYDKNGNSDRIPLTKEQIKVLYTDFFSFISKIKINGDISKKYLRENYKTMNLDQLKNYNTGIEI